MQALKAEIQWRLKWRYQAKKYEASKRSGRHMKEE